MNEEQRAEQIDRKGALQRLNELVKQEERTMLEVHRLVLIANDIELKRSYNILAMNLSALEQRIEKLREG